MIQVVVFSGGRGSSSIVEGLARSRSVALTVLVNAYDDGLSTGRIREAVGNMLGPSDIRKNYARLLELEQHSSCHALSQLLEYRIELSGWSRAQLMSLLLEFNTGPAVPEPILKLRSQLTVRALEGVSRALRAFAEKHSETFDFNDCAIGNIVLGGFHILAHGSFNHAVKMLQELEPVRHRILNVTQGEALRLCAVTDSGEWLPDEASVVTNRGTDAGRIRELFLVPGDSSRSLTVEQARAIEVFPAISDEADAVLRGADAILYAPGTQHSSLLPSYVTRGLGEAVCANPRAKKVFVFNLVRDHDLSGETSLGLFTKFFESFSRKGEVEFRPSDLLTEVFAPLDQGNWPSDRVAFPLETNAIQLLESLGVAVFQQPYGSERGTHHLPGQVANAVIERVIQQPLLTAYAYHLVSVIVPVLNEQTRIDRVMAEIASASWPAHLKWEVIFSDGGSTDQTPAKIEKFALNEAHFRLVRTGERRSRGEAIQDGIAAAKGDIIAIFHGDGEYTVDDLLRTLEPVQNHGAFAAIGSRVAYQPDVSSRLGKVYRNEAWLSRLSQFGGLLLGLGILLFFQRPISDPLSGIKVFNGSWLRRQRFYCAGVSWDVEVLLEILRQKKIMIEIPIHYVPRSKAEGKKTRLIDGLACLFTIVRERFRQQGEA